jgi:hypothetical protein
MLLNSSAISAQIRTIAAECAVKWGITLTPDGMHAIAEVPPNYRERPVDIDIPKLAETIEDIFKSAKSKRFRELDKAKYKEVMVKFDCHYLWFC